MADLLADIGGLLGASNAGNIAQNSTSRPNNTELNMEDFLKLMIVQLTSQTMDDTMDTSEMMNQMVQMQMITAITNLTDTSVQSYANSLVGQWVTVGFVQGNTLEERVVQIMGTGTYNGEQVVFGSDGNMYSLSQIMAVGVLPDENGKYPHGGLITGGSGSCGCCGGGTGGVGGTDDPVEEDPDPDMGIDPDPDPDDPDLTDPGDVTTPEGGDSTGGTENPEYGGENGVPSDTE